MKAVVWTLLAISLVSIGALMLPILRRHVDALGTAYAGIRLVEAIFIVVGALSPVYAVCRAGLCGWTNE